MATYMDAVEGKHTDGGEQGVNSAQARYVHIVQVHPVELGEPNLHKVKDEQEFETKELAEFFVKHYTEPTLKAVYLGRVNHETGELE